MLDVGIITSYEFGINLCGLSMQLAVMTKYTVLLASKFSNGLCSIGEINEVYIVYLD